MKASSFRYLINQGFKGIWKNRMMTFASFCILLVSLLMVGTSVLVSINLTRIIGGIEDKSEVIVIVKDGTSQADMQTLENKLKEVGNINTVSLYSKDEAWKNMLKGMTDEEKDFFQYADDNPLPDTYKVTVKDIEKMSETTTQIETFDNVDSTKSPTAFADILISIRRVFTIVAFAVIVALVVVCLIIISNTTRASVFARRKEINIMKYVGATNSFIRIPFFIEGMIVGLLAAAGALLLTKFAYEGIYNIFNDDFKLWSILGVQNLYSFKSLLLPVAASYLIAGAVIGAVVMYNLIENAIKFVDKGGYIEFHFEPEGNMTSISIRNSGEGLSEDELPLVFDRFYKTDKSRGLDKTGVGLGLNIVRSIIKLHGGKIMVRSVKNEYTEFVFTLPNKAEGD